MERVMKTPRRDFRSPGQANHLDGGGDRRCFGLDDAHKQLIPKERYVPVFDAGFSGAEGAHAADIKCCEMLRLARLLALARVQRCLLESIVSGCRTIKCLILDQYAGPEAIGERITLYRSEREGMGWTFDPMQVTVARQLYISKDEADKEAALARQAEYIQRTVAVSRPPDSKAGSLRPRLRRHIWRD